MNGTILHWVTGPWPGRLALAARPRGGDWLADEMKGWRHGGVHAVFSLLTPGEEIDLDLSNEAAEAKAHGMSFTSFPVPDRQVPPSKDDLTAALEKLHAELSAGTNVVLHCRQGIGRTGLVAACLLILTGMDAAAALRSLTMGRGVTMPETDEQQRWIEHYANSFTGAAHGR